MPDREPVLVASLRVGPADDLPSVVDVKGCAARPRERAEIVHPPVLPEERAARAFLRLAPADDLPAVVEAYRFARLPPERPEVTITQ